MIALDTNILVRFLIQDDPVQSRLASDLIRDLSVTDPGYVCREVLVELVWVLERSYKYSRSEIVGTLEGLLSARELFIEETRDIGTILQLYQHDGYGFSDLMIRQASLRVGAEKLMTFDQKAANLEGVELLIIDYGK